MDTKMVLVMRKDLKVRRGKECAQAGHASMAWLTNRIRRSKSFLKRIKYLFTGDIYELLDFSPAEKEWVDGSFAKVVLQVDSLDKLREIELKAANAHLELYLIVDSGRTEFDGVPTITALAIGPDKCENIDPITKNLQLY
jgi:PTH2 family peptidyl-tRNA hydrolase